jgi:hypothetical protein
MNLAAMQEQFRDHTSGLAVDLADGDITGYLDLIHKFVIPADVDGSIGEVVWSWTLAQGQILNTIPILDNIVSLNQAKAWIFADYGSDRTPIRLPIEYDYLKFITDWPDWSNGADPAKRGLPDVMCIYGTDLLFNRVADIAYGGGIQCRGGPAPLVAAGMDDDIRALATITGAAWIYLQEQEDASGAAREGGLYDVYKNLLNTRSGSRYQPRRKTRTF